MRRKTACTIQFSKSLAEASMDNDCVLGDNNCARVAIRSIPRRQVGSVVGWTETMASATLLLFRLTPRERGWT